MESFAGQRMHKRKFHQRQGIARVLGRVCLGGVLPAVLGAAVLYGLLGSSFFTIDRLDVRANPELDGHEVRARIFSQMDTKRFFFFSEKNIFLFRTWKALQNLSDNIAVESFTLEKHYPSQLIITIKGTPFRAVWSTKGMAYDLTRHGVVTGPVMTSELGIPPKQLTDRIGTVSPSSTPRSLPIIFDAQQQDVGVGDPVVPEEVLAAILKSKKIFESQKIPIISFEMRKGESEFHARTKEGLDIFLTAQQNIEEQTERTITVLREKIKEDRKNLSYIDPRFSDRVYFKLK